MVRTPFHESNTPASLPLRGAYTPSVPEGDSSGVKVSSVSETDEVSLP